MGLCEVVLDSFVYVLNIYIADILSMLPRLQMSSVSSDSVAKVHPESKEKSPLITPESLQAVCRVHDNLPVFLKLKAL